MDQEKTNAMQQWQAAMRPIAKAAFQQAFKRSPARAARFERLLTESSGKSANISEDDVEYDWLYHVREFLTDPDGYDEEQAELKSLEPNGVVDVPFYGKYIKPAPEEVRKSALSALRKKEAGAVFISVIVLGKDKDAAQSLPRNEAAARAISLMVQSLRANFHIWSSDSGDELDLDI